MERAVSDGAGAELTRLMRGISSDHVETVRDAWRALLGEGAMAVPLIEARLASEVWTEPPKGPA